MGGRALHLSQGVKQQGRENGTVALALDGVLCGRREQLTRLMVAERARFSFAALGPTLRVEMPCTYASWITAVSAFSAMRRGSRNPGK
jgi:hypothetical protein